MRLVIQRVSQARVESDDKITGEIEEGLLVLVGFAGGDTRALIDRLIPQLLGLRIFEDDHGKMNRDIRETGGSLLVVPNFTLHADCLSGRRPSFSRAAPKEKAEILWTELMQALKNTGVNTQAGVFGAHMNVSLVNDGPGTIVLDL